MPYRLARFFLVAVVLVAVACARESAAPRASRSATRGPAAGATSTAIGSCVERYSLDTLKKRDYAFDGTLRSFDAAATGAEEPKPQHIVFEVHKWFKGGEGAEATRRAYGFGMITSAGGTPHAVGERLLVAGDEDFIWECGFTQPYDGSVAANWERAFGS